MSRTPDSFDGPGYQEAIIWEEQTLDPDVERRLHYKKDEGLVILENGVVRGVGEGQANIWQYPVDEILIDTPSGSPAVGFRVIVGNSPTGAFIGHAGEIAQWTGVEWVFTTPKSGMVVYVKSVDKAYKQVALVPSWSWKLDSITAVATEVGQMLYSYNGTTFEIVKPLISDQGFTLTDDDAHTVVVE